MVIGQVIGSHCLHCVRLSLMVESSHMAHYVIEKFLIYYVFLEFMFLWHVISQKGKFMLSIASLNCGIKITAETFIFI